MERRDPIDNIVKTGRKIITNRQSRSTFFLILTILIVLGLNSFLPLIEGGAHYTEHAVECTYSEYLAKIEEDDRYALTYTSELLILEYKTKYVEANPGLSVEEMFNVAIPDNFMVSVYTQFFFQSTSWYVSTATHILSTIMIFYSVFNYILAKYKLMYKPYLDLSKELDHIVSDLIYPDTFEPWMVNEFNKSRKIRQHEVNIHAKLDKLESRTSYATRMEYKKYTKQMDEYNIECARYDRDVKKYYEALGKGEECIQPSPINVPEPVITDRKLRVYIDKRNKLNSFLEEFYINTYVVDGKVDNFVFIHPTFVLCGVNTVGTTYDSYSLIQSDAQRIGRQAVARVAKITGLTVMFALLTTLTVMSSFEKSVFWIAINIISKVVPLLSQVINAYDYRDNFMDSQLIPNLQYRRTIASLYMSAMKQKGATV